MTKEALEEFDEEKAYDEKISPLMTQIIAIAKEHKIPFFASFAFRHSDGEEGTGFCTTHVHFPERQPRKLRNCAAEVYDKGFTAFAIITGPKP